MINLMNLETNKVSIDLTGYSVVFMGKTGEGKTDSINKYLKSVSPEGKSPLILTFEDRYKNLTDIFIQRIQSIPEFIQCVNQLKNPKLKEKFSCVVIDTIDSFEEMASRYNATNKEVQIIEDLNFGKGKRYLNETIGYVNELRHMGYPVHFTAQAYEDTNIMTKQTTVMTKLKDTTKAQIFNQAYLVGYVAKDPKSPDPDNSDRLISFKSNSVYTELKDTFGMPQVLYISQLKDTITTIFENKYDKSILTNEPVIKEIVETETFEQVLAHATELGGLLATTGHLEEATHILRTTVGTYEDGSTKMLDTLSPAQIDLVKVVVLKLEELVTKYQLQ